MGWWARLNEWLNEPRYDVITKNTIRRIQQDFRSVYGNDPEVVCPLEAKRLKEIILSQLRKGGNIQYKTALATW